VPSEREREVAVEVDVEPRRDAISDLDLAEGLGALAGQAPVTVRGSAGLDREAVPVHVLAVDDEWAVRQLVARMGERVGLSVELAADGEEALTMFRAASDSFDLVLLDVNQPQLSGEEVFAAMREERPDSRVVFMSGYTAEDVLERAGNAAGVSMLEKPFTVGSFQRVTSDAVPAGVAPPEAATPPGAASEP
jgi:CheY-like chemotaxis protein